MGAEQIGYLCKGPMKIPAARIKAAVRACLKQRHALLADAGEGATRGERSDAALSATGESFDPEDIPQDPEPNILAFVEWWQHTDSCDTWSRQDPDDPRQKLVYAGDTSYGDEPDGQGYQMINQAFAWGYAGALGVR